MPINFHYEDKNNNVNFKGNYTVSTGAEKNKFIGSKKADTITINDAKTWRQIFTAGGNDTININAGSASISAGAGKDTINIATSGSVNINHTNGDGNDTITTSTSAPEISLNLKLQGEQFNNYEGKYYSNYFIGMRQGFTRIGNDLIMQVPTKLNKFETITFKDYYSTSLFDSDNITVNATVNERDMDSDLTGSLTKCLKSWAFWAEGIYDKSIKTTFYEYMDNSYNNHYYYSGSGKASILGSDKSDTYLVNFNKKSNLTINDSGFDISNGKYNSLYIKTNKSNLRAFFNVDANGQVSVSSSKEKSDNFILFHKDSFNAKNVKNVLNNKGTGFIDINNYFAETSHEGFEIGNGVITRIMADKNITKYASDSCENYYIDYSKSSINNENWIINITQDVAGWLSKHTKYTDAFDVIQNGSSKDIASLLKVYTANKPPMFLY